MSIYGKQFYQKVQKEGLQNVNVDKTLTHINLLFECFESPALELKQKFGIFSALESMVQLYLFQETGDTFTKNMNQIMEKIKSLT